MLIELQDAVVISLKYAVVEALQSEEIKYAAYDYASLLLSQKSVLYSRGLVKEGVLSYFRQEEAVAENAEASVTSQSSDKGDEYNIEKHDVILQAMYLMMFSWSFYVISVLNLHWTSHQN